MQRDGYTRKSKARTLDEALAAMGINWPMTWREVCEAIPPSYTWWIWPGPTDERGRHLAPRRRHRGHRPHHRRRRHRVHLHPPMKGHPMTRSVRTITIETTIETTEAGQRAPYGDGYFGATLTFACGDRPWEVTEIQVRQIAAAAALRYGVKVFDSRAEMEKENFACPYFEHVRRVEPGKWNVLIVEAYTD